MKFPDALYHYTVGPKLLPIAESGRLLPSRAGAQDGRERPVLWWSANRQWEPTATKLVSLDGGRTARKPSFDELQRLFGAYRFRLDTRNPAALHNIGLKLLPWPRVPAAARIPSPDVASMTAAGLEMGAIPMDWWGCLEEVPLALETSGMLRLDTMTAQGWESVEGGLAAVVSKLRDASVAELPPQTD